MNSGLANRLKIHLAAERDRKKKRQHATRMANWARNNRRIAMDKMEAEKRQRPSTPLPPMVEAWLICQEYDIPWDNLNPWYGSWR